MELRVRPERGKERAVTCKRLSSPLFLFKDVTGKGFESVHNVGTLRKSYDMVYDITSFACLIKIL